MRLCAPLIFSSIHIPSHPYTLPRLTPARCSFPSSICGSWQDALWAFFKVMLEAKLGKELEQRDTYLEMLEGTIVDAATRRR